MNTTTQNAAPEGRATTTAVAAEPDAAPAAVRAPAEVALPARLALVVEGIGAADARSLMRQVFAHSMSVLANVRRLRLELEQEAAGRTVPLLLREVSAESRMLLSLVETAELRIEHVTDEMRDTFDSVAFAMGHEMRRVFAGEMARHKETGRPLATTALVVRACGLVENCLQQSVITLAQAFDASVTGVDIFEDYRERRESALVLRAELGALAERVEAAARERSVLTNVSVLRHVRRFRYEHLHLLMYRDWEEFERFADALEQTYESVEAFGELLHTFSCYLTTLHGQVSLRAVLSEGQPADG
jgi:hypothetical protein